jgi:subtilisin family serine protease
VPAVKGDAARELFKVKCDEIRWAVLDSGIDTKHPAFQDADGKSRVEKAYDFSHIREVVSLDNLNLNDKQAKERARALLADRKPTEKQINEAVKDLRSLASDADNDRSIDWSVVAKFVELTKPTDPFGSHGTHVAGIIGANGEPSKKFNGMCPDIKLYDFRVLAKTLEDTEFAIIAALQFIRYLNERHSYTTVHGANLSLSIPHDVRNFACGRTPICNECERLVESGVVLVAAAGNLGYHTFETKDGAYEGYTAFSITDPGNADGVITVGATHRFWPHTYGVSFFSSRGPTGDGRMKPDLVAPGERIQSCVPGEGWGELDGTSMAAPHVSGAAAMLMGRYSELIGQPRRIKKLLCESATDLSRERTFQGHGMLDVLRAFQMM